MGGTIIVDTRQQDGKHDVLHDGLEQYGYSLLRSKVPFGDYVMAPKVSIDTKKDLYELAQCIDAGHERFKREQQRASDAGCTLYILTITDDVESLHELMEWVEPLEHFKMRKAVSGNSKSRRIEGKRIARACVTMSELYGFNFLFCKSEEQAAEIIIKLLDGGCDG